MGKKRLTQIPLACWCSKLTDCLSAVTPSTIFFIFEIIFMNALVHTVFLNIGILRYFFWNTSFWKCVFLTFFFLNHQPDFKGKTNTNQHTNKTKSSCISPVRILVNFWVWQHPEQDSLPICHKTTYWTNTTLKCLSDQWTSAADDCR